VRHIISATVVALFVLMAGTSSQADPKTPTKTVPPTWVVVDVNGKQVGLPVGLDDRFDFAYVIMRVGDVTFPVAVSHYEFIAPTGDSYANQSTLYFESGDCTGQPYVMPTTRISGEWVVIDGGIAYAPEIGATPQQRTVNSQRPDQLSPPFYCRRTTSSRPLVAAYELINLNDMFTPPFRLVERK
jgi:hypothetical protein